ncbi:sugar transporter [Phaeosphaeria sp. MPI-PUGE-AT-0046c]|nr:sugar transporter [Phaeosphaeria sp. MPI-PUGE-AT-0046c]
MTEKAIESSQDNATVLVQGKSSDLIQTTKHFEEGQVNEDIDATKHNLAVLNQTIESLGFGKYQWKMFFTCGFGFLVDQMLVVSVGLVIPQITKQWDVKYPSMLIASLYAGALVGALLCGFLLDTIGRKLVWQNSLFVVTIFTLIAASSPNFTALAIFIGLQCVGAGGNIAIDITVFTESIPQAKGYMLTALTMWWGIGNAVGGFLAWPLITHFSCPEAATPDMCSNHDNMGWRYQYILIGGLTFLMAVIRVFCMKMEESPKWLVTQGRYEDALAVLTEISKANQRDLQIISNDFLQLRYDHRADATVSRAVHVRGLFSTRILARSTFGLIVLWMCIGIAYPIYTLFLPIYLANNGANLGTGSTFNTYRDYSISSTVGIFGPLFSAILVNTPILGRRCSMAITALCAAAFAGAFTSVRSEASNIAFSSLLGFWQNAFYAILYSYTPEVLPTAHRGTGCGLTLALGRVASLSSPFIATFSDLNTSAPIWVCLGLYVVIAITAVSLPYEPKRFQKDMYIS